MAFTSADLLAFLRTQRYAVEASRAADGGVQAALVGIAVTDGFEIVFDTLATTRKARNLRDFARAALVIGGWLGDDERTVQYEGVADEPTGMELERVQAAYFAAWPDGRARLNWSGLVYIRVRPTWIRYSDFNQNPPLILEFTPEDLRAAPSE